MKHYFFFQIYLETTEYRRYMIMNVMLKRKLWSLCFNTWKHLENPVHKIHFTCALMDWGTGFKKEMTKSFMQLNAIVACHQLWPVWPFGVITFISWDDTRVFPKCKNKTRIILKGRAITELSTLTPGTLRLIYAIISALNLSFWHREAGNSQMRS